MDGVTFGEYRNGSMLKVADLNPWRRAELQNIPYRSAAMRGST
jgi:hypothetical protein